MCKIPVIFKIELTIEEAKDKIGVGEESHRQTCNPPPISNLLIVYGLSNDRACKCMSDTVHIFIITLRCFLRQIGNTLVMG